MGEVPKEPRNPVLGLRSQEFHLNHAGTLDAINNSHFVLLARGHYDPLIRGPEAKLGGRVALLEGGCWQSGKAPVSGWAECGVPSPQETLVLHSLDRMRKFSA